MNKEEGKESICSCSPNTRPNLHQCSSSATSSSACSSSACSSSNIRPNLRKRKRRRIHMANKKVSSFTMADGDLDDTLGEETIRKLKRERELERTWELHHDELINLLEAHCKGECSMGNTKDNKFWMRVTRTMVLRLGLKLDADEETCESCMKYVESLHKMYTDYKCKKKAIEKIQRAQPYLSPELISGLGRIFSEKISFKRASSVGKTSMTSRRSSSAKRRSNLSVNQPIIDENLIKDVEAAIFKLAAARVIDLKDVKEVKSYLLSDELLCKVFMRYTDEERVDQIKKLLTKCNTHS